MRKSDRQYGTPFVQYTDTKANIEALTGIGEGAVAYATDTNELGSYDGISVWTWGQGGVPVTLDANADTLLSLSTQTLGLDTQTANYIFSGPTTGAAAVPTFRAMVAADIPAGIVPIASLANASAQYKFPVSGSTPFAYAESAGGLNITAAKTLAVTNSITLSGGDGQTYTFPVAGGTVALLNAANIFSVNQTIKTDSTTALLVQNTLASSDVRFTVDTSQGTEAGACVAINQAPVVNLPLVIFRKTASKIGFANTARSASTVFNVYGITDNGQVLYINAGFNKTSGYGFQLLGDNQENLFVENTGNVGIGTGTVTALTSPAVRLQVRSTTATTNAVVETLRVESIVTGVGVGAVGFGVGFSFYAETATNLTNQQQGLISTLWTDATNATRKADMVFAAYDTASREGIRISADGTGAIVNLKGGQLRPHVEKTADYTITRNDYVTNVTANSVNITLPTAVGFTGQVYNVKNSGTGVITLLTTSSQTVDGGASGSITLDQYENLTVMSDGANWIIL